MVKISTIIFEVLKIENTLKDISELMIILTYRIIFVTEIMLLGS